MGYGQTALWRQKALEKEILKRKIKNTLKNKKLLSVPDQVVKHQALAVAKRSLGSQGAGLVPLYTVQKATAKVIGGALSGPAQRAALKLKAKRQATRRIQKLAAIQKQRGLTPQEELRLKTDTEAILNVAIPPTQVIHRGPSLQSKKIIGHQLHKLDHIKKKFPKGKRPTTVNTLVSVLGNNQLLPVDVAIAGPALHVLIPKIRSRKASPVSVAKALKSQQAANLAEILKKQKSREMRMPLHERRLLEQYKKQLAQLKLQQKRMRLLERMRQKAAAKNARQQAAKFDKEARWVQTSVASKEASILTKAASVSPVLQQALENRIGVALAEADLEDLAEEMVVSLDAEVLTSGVDDAVFVRDSQVAALLDAAAPTIDDAQPVVLAEVDTPAMDASLVEKLEAEKGDSLSSDELYDLADGVSVQLADEMLTADAKKSGMKADVDRFLKKAKQNLPLILIGYAAFYYVFLKK